ncbi:MAG: LuxR C-terminal-related transcriptional regulator [Acidimicrobiales bacterium]
MGDVPSATALLLESSEELGRDGMYVGEAACLHDAVRLGGGTPSVAERLGQLTSLVEGELMATQAAHGAAAVGGDWAAMAEVSERFEAMGALLVAAEAAAEAGRQAAAGGDARESTALTRRASDLASQCEGASTPALLSRAQPVKLTAREREVAALAAGNLTSKEIADRLFLSPRTVDNALQRIYGKLGVSRRSDLAAALDGMAQSSATPKA